MLEAYRKHGHLLETKAFLRSPQSQAVKESIAFMGRALGQDLTLRQLAEQAALSPSHYIRVFRRYTGLTPKQYVLSLSKKEPGTVLAQEGKQSGEMEMVPTKGREPLRP